MRIAWLNYRYVSTDIANGNPDKSDTAMDPTHFVQPPTQARWAPCDRACYHTLWWPVADPGARAVPAGPAGARCLPLLPQPPHRLLALCGEPGLRKLVHLHMQRLKHTPLFARAGRCFGCLEQRVADFVVEACGGPLAYSQRHARLVQAGAGLPLLLDEEGREIWLVQLWHAFGDAGFSPGLCADFWGWAEPLSVHLMAPTSRHPGLTRYPYDTVRSWFAPAR